MNSTERAFRKTVYAYYREHKRVLPWRVSVTPYKVLVSEVMLQQTQAERVVPKFREFLRTFPSLASLGAAPLSHVLSCWSGLGYNRRARFLHESAKIIATQHNGWVPRSVAELEKLPGIGAYSARAIAAFAYNEAHPFIETNIRAVYIHHFFPKKKVIADSELLPIIKRTLDTKNPREWYAALMDYGAYLKKEQGNPSRRSQTHTRQSAFKGSRRELRGHLLKELLKKPATVKRLSKEMHRSEKEIAEALAVLARDGLIVQKGLSFSVSS
ncbi:endonuclease III [Candidatus Kaiserbacteria bacterium CG10_big_fil_rev_8_21_14_0_10_49_17]|uniref:Adenine DNA glycosylase n=1 Tax=Candidatus Kaiserbacteria bacterium CG10_big_fil_rev_8_21_14_0_10_49_17 TaxID=1974609 RepID=A0A2M6WEP8_9BACT|nr:MAG: endonuclease III [Candidatus Kaiserbacteria bacterium CG10_big_fil_rev_8_21_14_0_10_49_17]